MSATCPKCPGKEFRNAASLNRHMAKYHAEQPPAPIGTDPPQVEPPAPPPAGDTLKVKPPPEVESYYCVDCAGIVKKGDAVCPTCKNTLDWSAVK